MKSANRFYCLFYILRRTLQHSIGVERYLRQYSLICHFFLPSNDYILPN